MSLNDPAIIDEDFLIQSLNVRLKKRDWFAAADTVRRILTTGEWKNMIAKKRVDGEFGSFLREPYPLGLGCPEERIRELEAVMKLEPKVFAMYDEACKRERGGQGGNQNASKETNVDNVNNDLLSRFGQLRILSVFPTALVIHYIIMNDLSAPWVVKADNVWVDLVQA